MRGDVVADRKRSATSAPGGGGPMHTDAHSVQRTFVHHVYATLARTPYNLDANGAYQATAHTYVACAACVDGVCH